MLSVASRAVPCCCSNMTALVPPHGSSSSSASSGVANYADQLDALLKEEQDLQFNSFTNDTALSLGLKLVEAAKAHKPKPAPVTINITRSGQQLFHCALAGTTPDNDEWIVRKSRIVTRFHHSSYYQHVSYNARGVTMAEKHPFLDPSQYSAFGGSFPIHIRNVGVVGTVTVSGLPQEQDHALVVAVIRTFLEGEAAPKGKGKED